MDDPDDYEVPGILGTVPAHPYVIYVDDDEPVT